MSTTTMSLRPGIVDTRRARPCPFPHAGHCCSTGIALVPRLVRVGTQGSIRPSRRKVKSVICNRLGCPPLSSRWLFRRADFRGSRGACVVLLPRDDSAHPASRVRHVSESAWNQVNVAVEDGLTG